MCDEGSRASHGPIGKEGHGTKSLCSLFPGEPFIGGRSDDVNSPEIENKGVDRQVTSLLPLLKASPFATANKVGLHPLLLLESSTISNADHRPGPGA